MFELTEGAVNVTCPLESVRRVLLLNVTDAPCIVVPPLFLL